MEATLKGNKGIAWKNALWNLISFAVSIVIGAALILWCYGGGFGSDHAACGVMIESIQTGQKVWMDFGDSKKEASSQIRYWEENLQLNGRIDYSREYFSGVLKGELPQVVITDLHSGESQQLDVSLRSFLLGDFYISSTYMEDKQETQLLIFYCPQ